MISFHQYLKQISRNRNLICKPINSTIINQNSSSLSFTLNQHEPMREGQFFMVQPISYKRQRKKKKTVFFKKSTKLTTLGKTEGLEKFWPAFNMTNSFSDFYFIRSFFYQRNIYYIFFLIYENIVHFLSVIFHLCINCSLLIVWN